jgi:5-methylcytosine-specific restriction endonuclease McrA
MPCHPARARELLRKGKAKVLRIFPFTLILVEREDGDVLPASVKIDPGSKKTGIALVADAKRGKKVVWAAEVEHRGQQIKKALDKRRAIRRGRRFRKTAYRTARFLNRTRTSGWLAPSIMSRVENTMTWVKRLQRFSPLSGISVERVKFDMQKMENSEVSGVEYQWGTLNGYEIREYLTVKWDNSCAYCGAKGGRLEIEHIIPKSKGGSNRPSNLSLACHDCNRRKGNLALEDFLTDKKRLEKMKAQLRAPLKDAAAVNSARNKIVELLSQILPLETGTGGQTKFNRTNQKYEKAHWIDAACVGDSGEKVYISEAIKPLLIKAVGHGDRQVQLMDKHGFPRGNPAKGKIFFRFKTGDIVAAFVSSGKKAGRHKGKVAVRASGSFNITTTQGTIQGISHKYCKTLHKGDGYAYEV